MCSRCKQSLRVLYLLYISYITDDELEGLAQSVAVDSPISLIPIIFRRLLVHFTEPTAMSAQSNGSLSSSTPASDIAKAAKNAFEVSQLIPSSERINALNAIKKELRANKEIILAANHEDLEVYFDPFSPFTVLAN